MAIVILDGAMGTELSRRGVSIAGKSWSASALESAPEIVRAIHRDYVNAGARVITANTFRTTPRASGDAWRSRMARAVAIAREEARVAEGEENGAGEAGTANGRTRNAPGRVLVAASLAPLEDCYRPDLAPDDDVLRREHGAIAAALAACEPDVLLCETFASPREAVIATECAAETGRVTWTALTAGFRGDLLSPEKMRETARACVAAGASAVFVNCVPAHLTRAFIDAIANDRVPSGAYANLDPHDTNYVQSATTYVEHARDWIASGATMIGGCCGTEPAHIRALAIAFQSPGAAM